MPSACLLCGSPTVDGLVCEKCDRRRRGAGRSDAAKPAAPGTAPGPVDDVLAAARAVSEPPPIEREISELLRVVSVPVVVIGADRQVTFLSSDAKTILALDDPRPTLEQIERRLERSIGADERIENGRVSISGTPISYSTHPLSSGGMAIALRRESAPPEADSETTLSYISQTVLAPLRALQDALRAAASNRNGDPVLEDAAGTIDQIFSSLELSPLSQSGDAQKETSAPATEIIKRVGERFSQLAQLKKVVLKVDAPGDGEHLIRDHERVQNVLVSLMENSLHYVPAGGQIVVGLRTLEQKGKKQLLFFVMDNGPLVPVEMQDAIFASDFVWKPSGDRSGRSLADARRFAQSRGGQVWVESKGGKACTFFLRLPAG